MTTIEKIEQEVSKLPPNELAKFREWFIQFDARAWDQQIEKDVTSGKIDDLAKQAINDFKNGKFKKI